MVRVEQAAEVVNEEAVLLRLQMRPRELERLGDLGPSRPPLRAHERVEVHAVHGGRSVERSAQAAPVLSRGVLAYAREKRHQAHEAQLAGGIYAQAQERHHVLDVQLLEHAHAARDAERHAVARQRELYVDRGVVRAVEDGDVAVRYAALLVQGGDEAIDDLGLRPSVEHVVQARLRRVAGAERAQGLLELVPHVLHHAVRHVEYRGHGAVVALELYDAASAPALGEAHNVLELRAAPRVDALEVVADDHDVSVPGGEDVGELGLERVRVLVLVHEHVEEVLLQEGAHSLVLAQKAQAVDEQVVEVHRPHLPLLRLVCAAHG